MPDNMDPAADLWIASENLRQIKAECTSGMRVIADYEHVSINKYGTHHPQSSIL